MPPTMPFFCASIRVARLARCGTDGRTEKIRFSPMSVGYVKETEQCAPTFTCNHVIKLEQNQMCATWIIV